MSDSEMVIRPEDTAAKSDQLNADDLRGGPIVGRIVGFKNIGEKDQPWHIRVDCWPQPWKPSKGQRRILLEAWGSDPHAYIGRAVELLRDPTVTWGGKAVGGVVIGGLSHIGHDREYGVTRKRNDQRPQPVRCLPTPAAPASFEDRRKALVQKVMDKGLIDDADAQFGPPDEWDADTCKRVAEWLRGQQ